MKRLFDIVAAALGLVLLSPLLAADGTAGQADFARPGSLSAGADRPGRPAVFRSSSSARW